MKWKTLTEIQNIVKDLASRINVPIHLLPTFRNPIGDGTPNIEVDNSRRYHYVISERGTEYKRKTTSDLNELMYWVFSDITFSIACDYEVKNRIIDKDSRRIIFMKQQELLNLLNKDWVEKESNEYRSILINNPFDDLAGLRATYSGELRAKGLSEGEIEKLVYEMYPEKEILCPMEKEIIGKWIYQDGKIAGDSNCDLINSMIKNDLKEVEILEDGWALRYQHINGSIWELTYPESTLHGGGPPKLTRIKE